jgi:hypothetical protein
MTDSQQKLTAIEMQRGVCLLAGYNVSTDILAFFFLLRRRVRRETWSK